MVFEDIEVHALHLRAEVLSGHGKEGVVESLADALAFGYYLYWFGLVLGGTVFRKFVAVDAHKVESAARIGDFHLQGRIVDVEGHFLVGQLLEQVRQSARRQTDFAFALRVAQFYAGRQCGVGIGAGKGELAVFEFKQEVVEDNQRVLGADYLAYS